MVIPGAQCPRNRGNLGLDSGEKQASDPKPMSQKASVLIVVWPGEAGSARVKCI